MLHFQNIIIFNIELFIIYCLCTSYFISIYCDINFSSDLRSIEFHTAAGLPC